MGNKEIYSSIIEDTTKHKEDLENNADADIKKKAINIFLTILGKKIQEIQKEDIPEKYKKEKIKMILENAQDLWKNHFKKSNKIEKIAIRDKYKIYINSINALLEKNLTSVNKDILKDKLDKIESIKFSENFKIPEDINDLKEQFDDAIKDLEALAKKSKGKEKEKYEDAIFVLKNYKRNLDTIINQTKNFDAKKIANKIDNLAEKALNHKGNGPITLELFNGVQKTFRNKAEALNTLEEMKKQLSDEFTSGKEILWNIISAPYIATLKLAKTLTIGEESSKFDAVGLIKEGFLDTFGIGIENDGAERDWDGISQVGGVLEMALGLGLGIAGVSIIATFIGFHVGIPESMIRRSKDFFSRYSASMQFEDYGKTGKVITSPGDPKYKDFLNYTQRMDLMDQFDQKLKSLDPNSEEYKKLEKNIEILDKFKLNKTNTFYYLANKIAEGYDLGFIRGLTPGRFFYDIKNTIVQGSKIGIYNPFKDLFNKDKDWIRWKNADGKISPKIGGFYTIPIDSSKTYYDETVKWLNNSNKTSYQKGIDLFYKDKKVKIEKTDESIKLVTEGDSNKKTELYNYIKDYIKSKNISTTEKQALIKKFDEYIEKIPKTLFNENQIKSDLVILLDENLGDQNDFLKKVADEIDEIKNQKSKSIKDKIPFIKNSQEEIKKIKALENFQKLLYKKEWIGNKKEFNDILERVKTQNIDVQPNINSKLGGDTFNEVFQKISKKGENLNENIGDIKNTLFDYEGNDLDDSTKTQYVKNVEDYISYIADNDIEKNAKEKLNNFLTNILEGNKVIESEDKLNYEIGRIIKGGLTEEEIIDKIKLSEKNNYNNFQKNEIKRLINEISSNPDLLIKDEELKTILGQIRQNQSYDLNNVERLNLSDITDSIQSAENMRKRDFEKKLNVINKDKSNFFNEIKDTINLNENITDKENTINEINKLLSSAEDNKYTDLQIINIIEKIKQGESFDNINHIEEADSSKVLFDLLEPENKKLLIESINKIEAEKNNIKTLDELDKVNKKIDILEGNKYFEGLEKDEKQKLQTAFEEAKKNVYEEFKSKTINEKIKYLSDNKEYHNNNFKKSIIEDFIEETISEIDNSDLSNQEKVKKAEDLRKSIKAEIDSRRIQFNIDKLIGLSGISKLEASLKSFENEVRNQEPNKARLKTIIGELDKLYLKDLADDDLRSKIDILKTEINYTLKGTGSSTKKSTSSPETTQTDFENMSSAEKNKRIDKFTDLYNRAIEQAKINGNYDLAHTLSEELNNPNLSDEDIIKKVDTLESNLKRRLGGITKLKKLEKLNLEYEKLKTSYISDLLNANLIEPDGLGGYKYKDLKTDLEIRLKRVKNPGAITYFKKAFQ